MKIDIWGKNAARCIFIAQMALGAVFFIAPVAGIIYLNSLPIDAQHAMAVMIESHQDWILPLMCAFAMPMLLLHLVYLEGGCRRRKRAHAAYFQARAKGLSWAPYGWGRAEFF